MNSLIKIALLGALAAAFIEPAFAGSASFGGMAASAESEVVNELVSNYKLKGNKKKQKARRKALKACFSKYYKAKATQPLLPLPALRPHPPLPKVDRSAASVEIGPLPLHDHPQPPIALNLVRDLKACVKKAVKK